MSSLDNAAMAFDKDSGNSNGGGVKETVGVEDVFANSLKGIEVDEGSPSQGGGDDTLPEGYTPPDGEEAPRRRTRKAEVQDEDQDDDDIDPIYGDVADKDPPDDDEDDKEDDDEGEDEDDDEDEDDEEAEEAVDLSEKQLARKVKVTVDGKEQVVTMREAIDGYIRTDTFYQRLNRLNEAGGLLEQEAHKVVAKRSEAAKLYDDLEEAMTAILPKNVDWDKLYAEDPKKARSMQKSFEEIEGKLKNLRDRRDAALAETDKEAQAQTRRFAQSEQEKFEAMNPHWRGQNGTAMKKKDLSSMARTAKAVGFSEKEIVQVYDSRMLNVLLKASKYDRMMAARPKPNKGRTPAKPGAGRPNGSAPRGERRAAPSSGSSIDRAADVFTQLITQPRRRR